MKRRRRITKASNPESDPMKNRNRLFLVFSGLIAMLWLVACPTSEDPGQVLTMKITPQNDSLLTFDSLIVTVHSADGKFSQDVFHGVLRNPSQVKSMPLDPRVGKDYTVTIVGYRGGKIGVNKEVTFTSTGAQSKDVPIHIDKPETVIVDPTLPEIQAPSDTSVAEGDSLRFRVTVTHPWNSPSSLTLKDAIPGATLDTTGRNPGEGYFVWRPNYDQGRTEVYAVTFVYATVDKRVEKITRVRVLNVNRAPKFTAITDQKVKEKETLTFKVTADDQDGDSLSVTTTDLPTGAFFTTGTFTWTPSVGQAGNYSVKFKVSDGKDSDMTSSLITVGNVDAPPPLTVKITSPSQDTLVNVTPITIQYTVNGTVLQKKIVLKDGKNKIFIDTTVAGRTSMDTITIALDTIPPGRPNVNGASPVRTRTPTWTWSGGGGGSGQYRYSLDNPDMTLAVNLSDTTFTAAKDLEPGTHTLYVQERDAAGNWSLSGNRSVQIDTTRPSAPEVSVNPVSPTNDTRPIWNWKGVGENLSGLFRYMFDSKDFSAGATETRNLSLQTPADKPLAEGRHTLYVQQQSTAGNWSPSASASVFIDLTPPGKPKVTLAQASPTNNPRPTWNLSSGEGGMGFYRAKLDDSNLTQGAKSGSFAGYTPDTSLANGTHALYVQERDSAGNWSSFQYAGIVVDLVPPAAPVFDSIPRSPLNSLQPTWTWKSGGGGMGAYRYKLDDSVFTQSTDTIKLNAYTPASALKEGPHVLYLQERDSAGNWSKTASKSIYATVRGLVGTAGFSSGTAGDVQIAQSVSGELYTAFIDGSMGDWTTVMKYSNGIWATVGKPGFSVGQALELSLVIGANGKPFLAYQDISNARKATVMRYTGSFWESIGIPGFSQAQASYISLALNSKDSAYVAFMDGAASYKASVMRYNGSNWDYVGTQGFTSAGATYVVLALTSAGVPFVAFSDASFAGKATVMRWTGNQWILVGAAGFSAGAATSISLAFNTADQPYVAFTDAANGNKATVMKLNGTSWESVGTAGFSAGFASTPSLSMNSSGMPYVAYQDGGNEYKATVMYFNGKAWQPIGGEGITSGEVGNTSLVVDKWGVPYVAYQDPENGSKISVLRTAFDP